MVGKVGRAKGGGKSGKGQGRCEKREGLRAEKREGLRWWEKREGLRVVGKVKGWWEKREGLRVVGKEGRVKGGGKG